VRIQDHVGRHVIGVAEPGNMKIKEITSKQVNESMILSGDSLIDVFIKGRVGKETVTKSIAKNIPNKNLDKLVELLVTKYNVNPNTIIYGPSKK